MKHTFRYLKFKIWDYVTEKMLFNVFPTKEDMQDSNKVILINTELIDCAGNDIYYKDLIEFHTESGKKLGVVEYSEGRYFAKVRNDNKVYINWRTNLDQVKVIGNYYSSKWFRDGKEDN